VIITCEKCETRFRLQDERIPEKGTQVRCSRCATSFFVPHPSHASQEASPLQASSVPVESQEAEAPAVEETPPTLETPEISAAPESPVVQEAPPEEEEIVPEESPAEEDDFFGGSSPELGLNPNEEHEEKPDDEFSDEDMDGFDDLMEEGADALEMEMNSVSDTPPAAEEEHDPNEDSQFHEAERSDQYSAEMEAMEAGNQMSLEVEPTEETVSEDDGQNTDDEMDWEFDQPPPPTDGKSSESEDTDERDDLFGNLTEDGELAADSEDDDFFAEEEVEEEVAASEEETETAPEELGSPEDWDLLGSKREEPLGENSGHMEDLSPSTIGFEDLDLTHAEPPLQSTEAVSAPSLSSDEASEVEAQDDENLATASSLPTFSMPQNATALLQMAGHAVGWMVAVILFASVAYAALLPPTQALIKVPSIISVSGYSASELKAEFIENQWAGTLLVISGQLTGGDDSLSREFPHLSVSLSSDVVELVRAPLGPTVPERALRERPLDELRKAQVALSRQVSSSTNGSNLGFQAIFSEVPAGATRFDVVIMRSME
jgi:predicted Zn finger-like uncharacterized protein